MKNKGFNRQLKRYVARIKKWDREIIKKNKFDKEQNTIVKFVIPFFEMLGWGSLYQEMDFEYTVKKGSKKIGAVDIVLYSPSPKKQTIFVEVKPLQKKIGKGTQLFKYLKAANVKFGIYTNGKQLKLVDKRYTREQHGQKKYVPHTLFALDIKDFYKYRKVLRFLSKEYVKNGRLCDLADSFHGPEFRSFEKIKLMKEKKDKREALKYKLRLEHAKKYL